MFKGWQLNIELILPTDLTLVSLGNWIADSYTLCAVIWRRNKNAVKIFDLVNVGDEFRSRGKQEGYNLLADMYDVQHDMVMSFGWNSIFQRDEILLRELADVEEESVHALLYTYIISNYNTWSRFLTSLMLLCVLCLRNER